VGLRVTACKDRPPEIELTLDPDALPSTDAASEVLEEAKKVASVEALEEVHRELLRPYKETVLDEETGEWVPADVDPERELEREAETEYEDRPFVSNDSTAGCLSRTVFQSPPARTPLGAGGVSR
jgi:hypothetical protein